jgi:hypothetical protein
MREKKNTIFDEFFTEIKKKSKNILDRNESEISCRLISIFPISDSF